LDDSIFNIENCSISGQDAERLAGVLAQCPALSRLNLDNNQLGAEGAGSLAEVLPQCLSLFVLSLRAEVVVHAKVLHADLRNCRATHH
jgi:hypothetical protein